MSIRVSKPITTLNVNGIIDVLTDIRELGMSYNVTLYYQDGEYNRVGRGIHINLDHLPMDILYGRRQYVLKIRYFNLTVFMENTNPYRDWRIHVLKGVIEHIKTKTEVMLVNKKRKQTLDYILDDNQPLSLES